MFNKKLYETLLEEFGKRGLEDIEIPFYIKENLSKELRIYQEKALKYYYANIDSIKQNHLMFNMATGSGKTLIMAALILDCYKRGYRDFIFFVNTNSILEKTKANFADKYSSKYLFKESINVDSENVEINIINNLSESKDECINIHFTTIQALYSLFKNEKENSLSFSDLVDKKIVLLADEAHHLNSDTKSKSEKENKEGWETIITKAYESNKENLLFEFSATIPQEANVLEKYTNKIIYEYALKEFCKDGYSKRIFLTKYNNETLEYRILGSMLTSLYRELLAQKHNIILKPVIMYKSESINESKQNEKFFINFLENLETSQISSFYESINKESELLHKSLEFFKREYGLSYANSIINFLKNNFKSLYILNTNDEKELEKNQVLLNTLEDTSNEIRVIFSVDKLNEGWDVLNLFDIVRLGGSKVSKAITTKEVQLIGRGARYYPFKDHSFELDSDSIYVRKYDNDLDNELNALERLSYHTINDVAFIENLNESMNKQGLLFEEEKKRVDLIVNEKIKPIINNNKIYYANNKRIRRGDLTLPFTPFEIKQKIKGLQIPLFSNSIKESEEKFEIVKEEYDLQNSSTLEFIDTKYFLKAMNMLGLSFKEINENLDFKSKRDFIENYLKKIYVCFSKKQTFNVENKLEIAKYVLENFKSLKQSIKQEYEVSEFQSHKFNISDRIIFKNDDNFEDSQFAWLYHKTFCYDSKLEREFLEFIESRKNDIDKMFSQWFIIRNEGFKEFKIYDNRVNEVTYGMGFEPDFIFFGKRKDEEDNKFLSIQCFMETKGEHLAPKDSWKEDFLAMLKGKKINTDTNQILTLESLPFFINKDISKNQTFIDEFDGF
ncbi:DEAD/DEAH box helicase family protein [Helicobacter bilis]|uniref:DEAD/DEAH box helicase family protein n=2 Tax=Bacteria TaxID=2 RepID=UPI0026ECCAB5|nr:DEAD/DEAH box helicase family protein [Helicobacter bilis]MCI7411699.1 DEAD/DEAH box helicase family protein [Helicobacter bilis]MDD7296331.1 DEAD/DEAH box helicase family protein [Helicobacter bilis]MDY4400555.1 DEAD/DEAH box helicase family protein [Helicobacter bilis]